jgi:cell division protein FtsL
MIYTLLIALIILLVAVVVWQRYEYRKLLTYTRHSDTERLAIATELQELKEQSDYINFTLHGGN